MAVTHPDAIRNDIVDLVVDKLDSGKLRFFTGANGTGTQVAELDFAATAFNAAGTTSPGDAEANTIDPDINCLAGTALFAQLIATNGTTVVVECSVGTGSADINLSSNIIAAGDTIAVADLTYSAPA